MDLYVGTATGWRSLKDGTMLGAAPVTDNKPRVAGLSITDTSKLSNYTRQQVSSSLDKADTWAVLEPTQGNYNWTPIYNKLAAIPDGCTIKLSVDGGNYSPQWLKDQTGEVTVMLTRAGTTGTCAKFWTQTYIDAYNAFQTAMAAEFDNDPRIRQVCYTGTMTENSEPFTLGGDDTSGINLYNAGMTWDNEKTSFNTMLSHQLSVWKSTRVELALHTAWQYPTATGIGRGTWTDIENFVDPFVQQNGTHICTANYGLGPADTDPSVDPMYTYMAARKADSGFQLTVGTPYNADTRMTSVMNGVRMGVAYIEHSTFTDGIDSVTGQMVTMEEATAALQANVDAMP